MHLFGLVIHWVKPGPSVWLWVWSYPMEPGRMKTGYSLKISLSHIHHHPIDRQDEGGSQELSSFLWRAVSRSRLGQAQCRFRQLLSSRLQWPGHTHKILFYHPFLCLLVLTFFPSSNFFFFFGNGSYQDPDGRHRRKKIQRWEMLEPFSSVEKKYIWSYDLIKGLR